MTLILPAGTCQATLRWTSNRLVSGRAVTVFGLSGNFPDTAETAENVALEVFSRTNEYLLPLLDSNAQFEGVEVITPTAGAEIIDPSPGAVSRRSIIVNSAALVTKVTAVRGRRAQGRMFLPLMLDGEQVEEDGVIVESVRANLNTALRGWLQEIQTNLTCDMVILQNSEGISPPISPPPRVSDLVVENKVASQRRRLRR